MSLNFHLFMFSISCFKLIVSYTFSYTLVGLIVVLEIVALITVLQIKTLKKKLAFAGCNGLGCLGFYLFVVFCHGIAKGGDC